MRGERSWMSDEQLDDIRHVARREAAPFVLIAAVADLALAAISAWHGWQLYTPNDWWIWLVLALPAAILALVFSRGLGWTGLSSEHRRMAALVLLGVLATANLWRIGSSSSRSGQRHQMTAAAPCDARRSC